MQGLEVVGPLVGDDQHYDEAGDVVRASQERSHRLHSGVLIHHLQVGGCNLGIF